MAEDKVQTTDKLDPAKTTDLPKSDAPIAKEAPALPPGVVASLPEDATVHSGTSAAQAAVNHPPVFTDKFAGKSGSFVIDGKTGERKQRFEPVYQDGQQVGFKKVA